MLADPIELFHLPVALGLFFNRSVDLDMWTVVSLMSKSIVSWGLAQLLPILSSRNSLWESLESSAVTQFRVA